MLHFARGVREWATPALKDTAFIEKGVLTPEEFVAAGDELVSKFPTWQWQSGDPKKTRAHLPPDKQYLLTRNVPCRRRVRVMETDYKEEVELDAGDDGDGWLATHSSSNQEGAEEEEEVGEIGGGAEDEVAALAGDMGNILGAVVEDYAATSSKGGGEAADGAGAKAEEDEYADMADFEDDNLVQEDEATIAPEPAYVTASEPDDTIVHTRTYDLTISYDKYYQTPRVWLFGYDENRQPLTQDQIYEDIMQDYAKKTVTVEAHPHLNEQHASIHPCQHAPVMKRIVDHLCAGGKEPQTDQYLFIFLKFIQSVIPTVDYDFTTEVEAK